MRIIDGKLKGNVHSYIFQSLLATLTIIIILFSLNVSENTAVIASLGATAFIVFTMPRAKSSNIRRLLGGYAVGLLVGCLFSYIKGLHITEKLFSTEDFSYIICGGFAVGFAIFIMVITNTEHPPAAGIALGLVINSWDYRTLIVIVSAVAIMAIIRNLLKSRMMDLV